MYIGKEKELNKHEESMILGSFFWGYLLSQFAGSTMAKKWGGKITLATASCFWSFFTFITPFCINSSVTYAILVRILLGIAEGKFFF